MSLAHRCQICEGDPAWTIVRRGDVVVSWSCSVDLSDVCYSMQRDHEITELVITDSRKAREWNEISKSLDNVIKEELVTSP